MADLITNLIPRGRPVTLGGRVYLVPEARLSDLADLQGWIDARQPDPTDGLPEAVAGLDPVSADRVLLEALDRIEEGTPSYDSIDGTGLLYTTEGKYAFLAIALARTSPRGEVSDLLDDLEPITDDQLDRLRRVFFGYSDARVVMRLLKFPQSHRPTGRMLTWGEAIDALARSHGWTYETIYGLTLTEFANARRHGRPLETGFQGSTADLIAMERRIKLARYGIADEPEPVPTPSPPADEWIYPATKEAE